MNKGDETVKTPDPEYAKAAEQVFIGASFVTDVGLELLEVGPGWAETRLGVLPRHHQQTGIVHAGVQATMADHTSGTAATTVLRQDEFVLSTVINLNLLRPATGQELRCRATVLKPGRQIVVVEAEVYASIDGASILVSKATVTLAVLKKQA
ncbi:MAG: PaaI family thioesterase [Chloroflexota bacterium]